MTEGTPGNRAVGGRWCECPGTGSASGAWSGSGMGPDFLLHDVSDLFSEVMKSQTLTKLRFRIVRFAYFDNLSSNKFTSTPVDYFESSCDAP